MKRCTTDDGRWTAYGLGLERGYARGKASPASARDFAWAEHLCDGEIQFTDPEDVIAFEDGLDDGARALRYEAIREEGAAAAEAWA